MQPAGRWLWLAFLCGTGVPCADAQVGTWNLVGRPKAVACLAGRCAQERGPVQTGIVEIAAEGTYRSPNSGSACTSASPDEVGTWTQDGQTILFEPQNLDDIVTAVEACFDGVTMDVRDYRNKAKLKRNGTLLRGTAKLRGRVQYRGRSISVAGILRWKGTPAASEAGAMHAGGGGMRALVMAVEAAVAR